MVLLYCVLLAGCGEKSLGTCTLNEKWYIIRDDTITVGFMKSLEEAGESPRAIIHWRGLNPRKGLMPLSKLRLDSDGANWVLIMESGERLVRFSEPQCAKALENAIAKAKGA
jgi:hypothetical protein